MTFYEAALRVLESEGRPLHFLEITEKSVAQNLLSHVGKTPEQTMLSRLATMARRTRDRKVIVTAKDTFALVDWAIPEDVAALAQTGVPEPHPEESLPPLRPPERHPDPRIENARGIGRVERRRRKDEEDDGRRRRRRYPPIAEVTFEILSDSEQGLNAEQLANAARERELGGDELGAQQILTAVLEDNQRRMDAGRRPQFLFSSETGQISLERSGSAPGMDPAKTQAALAAALGLSMEGGRPILPKPSSPASDSGEHLAALASAKQAAKEARRAAARALKKRLSELELGTLEKAVGRMLHGHGFRDLKVAKRSREGLLLTARRRDGSLEWRYAVRLLSGNPLLERRAIQELRRDISHCSAHVGLLISAGDLRGDSRSDVQAGGSWIQAWCGDALGEKFLEVQAGVTALKLELFELDPRFFEQASAEAEEARRKRLERQREREMERNGAAAQLEPPPASPSGAPSEPEQVQAEGDEADSAGDSDETSEQEASAAAGGTSSAPSNQRRRRRRRRGRRGRPPRPEGSASAQGSASGQVSEPPAPASSESAAPPPSPEPTNDGGQS